jgi:hypothetical protein
MPNACVRGAYLAGQLSVKPTQTMPYWVSRQQVTIGRMFISFLVASLLAMSSVAPCWSPTPTPCSYSSLPPAKRQLFQRIDQTLPRVVRRMRQANPTQRIPYVELDSCFHAVVLERLFTKAAEMPMRHDLRQLYYKEMGIANPQDPQAANLLVLEYTSVNAAARAEHLQDSLFQDLQRSCQGWIMKLEPCVELDSHRFTRIGSHLLHYNLYSQDPNWESSLWQLASTLTSHSLNAAASPGHVPAATPRRTTPKNRP